MAYKQINNVIILDYSDINTIANNDVEEIIGHTYNTWQPDRSLNEKRNDTLLGKHAEDAVISTFKEFNINHYYSYDSFRNDNFKFHAPFDGIFVKKLNNEIINFIDDSVKKEGSILSLSTKAQLRKLGCYTVEVKSTRLAQKYKDRANFTTYSDEKSLKNLIDSLMNLDYLTYPHYTRYGDMSFYQYCQFVKNKIHLKYENQDLFNYIQDIELAWASDIYIRVFMDEIEQKALIMGWIDRQTFLNPPETHKLILPGKSEVPLYLVKSLKKGFSILKLSTLFND